MMRALLFKRLMLAVSVLASASIALLNDRLELVPYLIRLGRRPISTIKINTTVGLGTKLIFIGLAIAGLSSLALAILPMWASRSS